MNIASWTIVFLTALSICATFAQDKDGTESVSDRSSKPGWSIETTVSPKTPRLSDSISLEFVVEWDPTLSLKDPELLVAPNDFTIRQPLEQIETSSGNRRVFRAVVAPVQAGEIGLPRLAISYVRSPSLESREQASSQGIMASPRMRIEILSSSDDDNLAAIRSRDIETLPGEANFWQAWGLLILGLAGTTLLGLVGFVVRLWYLKRHSKPETPEEIANRLLQCLSDEKLPEQGRVQEFYVRLTGIVREFIAKTTELHAPELTTEEFWLAAQSSPRFSKVWSQTLRDFLVAADLVKFGGQRPDHVAMEQAIATAREAVHCIASSSVEISGGT
jgi:hypothetical protein